jgi:MFS superfamily sulfate permease-like transporter
VAKIMLDAPIRGEIVWATTRGWLINRWAGRSPWEADVSLLSKALDGTLRTYVMLGVAAYAILAISFFAPLIVGVVVGGGMAVGWLWLLVKVLSKFDRVKHCEPTPERVQDVEDVEEHAGTVPTPLNVAGFWTEQDRINAEVYQRAVERNSAKRRQA